MRNWSNDEAVTKRKMRRSGLRAWRDATAQRRKLAGKHFRGKKLSKEHVAKIVEGEKRSWLSLERRDEASKVAKKNWKNSEYRDKTSAAIKLAAGTPEAQAKRSKNSTQVWKSEKLRSLVSRKARERWQDGRFKKSISRAMKEGWDHKPEAKLKIAESAKKRWKDTAFKKQVGRKVSKTMKLLWQDHNFKTKMLRKFRSPENREKISKALLCNSRGAYRESTLEYWVVNWARKRGILVFKTDSHHSAGAPDRIFCMPGGRPFFIEFKRPDGKGSLGKLQIFVINKLKKAGYDVCVFNNKEEAITALKERLARST